MLGQLIFGGGREGFVAVNGRARFAPPKAKPAGMSVLLGLAQVRGYDDGTLLMALDCALGHALTGWSPGSSRAVELELPGIIETNEQTSEPLPVEFDLQTSARVTLRCHGRIPVERPLPEEEVEPKPLTARFRFAGGRWKIESQRYDGSDAAPLERGTPSWAYGTEGFLYRNEFTMAGERFFVGEANGSDGTRMTLLLRPGPSPRVWRPAPVGDAEPIMPEVDEACEKKRRRAIASRPSAVMARAVTS